MRLHAGTCAALALAICAVVGGHVWASELPRYKLQVGDELTYRTADDPTAGTEENATRAKSEWIFTVLKQHRNGGWRILFRTKTSFGSSYERTGAGHFELKPDGQVALNPTVTLNANPTPLFPALPPDEAAIKSGWSSSVPLDETTRNYQAPAGPPAADDTNWAFEEDTSGVFTPIYELAWHHVNVFDLQQGVVRRISSTYSQGWPKRDEPRKGRAVMELVERRQIESPELAALERESDRFFAMCDEYDKLMAGLDFRHPDEALKAASRVLADAEDELKLPAVQSMWKDKRKTHGDYEEYHKENAERFGKYLDKPSEDWQTEDLDGHPRSLADYNGKVVLLDFWYRGCGWCIRAMPQLKQLADDFPKDKVAVLGMNNDRELDDARHVIKKMGLPYETLKNGGHEEGIHSRYGVRGWPTLVILDAEGVVRHVHVGYSPTLRDELSAKIRELLAENVAAK